MERAGAGVEGAGRLTGLLPIAVISAAILAYEVLLMRLFSIQQWYHFAYMIISIALLGFGASGTFLALGRERLLRNFTGVFTGSAALFGLTSIASFALAQQLPFNALEIVWDPGELVWLFASYALLILPFFFGGACIGLAFSRYGDMIGRVYAYDLVGAGIGALGIVAVLFVLPPSDALRLVGALGLVAAALAALQPPCRRGRTLAGGFGIAALALAVWLPPAWTAVQPSQYKGLSMALTVPGARIIEERFSPLGQLSVVESPTIPFRHAPGLSLANTVEPPAQLGVFTDADGLSVITAFDGDAAPLAYLDYTTSALPYHLLDGPKVLVLGAGGGADVLQAIYHGATHVDAVEVDREFIDLVRDEHADFAGGLYDRPDVEVHLGEARSFVARTDDTYDLIQLPLLDSFGAAAAGVHSLHESYIYTVEAFGEYLDALRPGGMLAITRWLKLPPRDSLKLFGTALEALERAGVADPASRVVLIRSWKTTTLLVRNGAFTPAEIVAVRGFTEARSFDLVFYPGIARDEVNRFNLLDEPHFFAGATALAGPGRQDYLERYKFEIGPATDDQPYFFDFFRWAALPEMLELRTQGGAAMLDWGYLILFATFLQALVLSLVLILAPLWLRQRRPGSGAPRSRIAFYFLALGLGFLFIEIAFIQRFILFLGHPLYAVAVVLAGFLVFAGLGSACSERFSAWYHRVGPEAGLGGTLLRSALDVAVGGIALITLLYLFLLPPLFEALMALPDLVKVAVSLTLIAPLAFFMGMPFPIGLARISRRNPGLVPWAWGINGCASVLSAILATILAIHIGFSAVLLIAVGLYLGAAVLLPVRRRDPQEAVATAARPAR